MLHDKGLLRDIVLKIIVIELFVIQTGALAAIESVMSFWIQPINIVASGHTLSFDI